MIVLKQSSTENHNDEENSIPRLDCVMGPYWVMTVCVTYPIVLVISAIAAVRIVNHQPWPLIIVWAILTVALLLALSMVACRDPGIMRRYPAPPDADWRWNDQARTFRPKGAKYDPDCAVVVESFDHTCPWTGTAIGKRNIIPFRCFVILIVVCLVFDIVLIISPLMFG
jgi:membrane protein YdbS with pleckstrin-like domain